MPKGRPSFAQDAIVSFMESKSDRVLDLKLDGPGVQHLARQRLGSEINLRKAVERLILSGRLHPLQAGRFAFTEEPARSPRLMDLDPVVEAVLRRLEIPYYLSWHSALWHHGLVDQQSRRLYAAVTRRKREAKVGAGVIQFVFISDMDKFFGDEVVTSFEWPVRVARAEKAIIDSFDRPRYAMSVPVIADALRRGYVGGMIDPQRLVSDALRFRSPHLNRRLGFFMDLFEIPGSDELALRIGRGYAIALDAKRRYGNGAKPPVNRRWLVYEDPGIVGTAEELK
jgi:predicted transcriptional regulator of viral defense system